jgi:hypothetical protein
LLYDFLSKFRKCSHADHEILLKSLSCKVKKLLDFGIRTSVYITHFSTVERGSVIDNVAGESVFHERDNFDPILLRFYTLAGGALFIANCGGRFIRLKKQNNLKY